MNIAARSLKSSLARPLQQSKVKDVQPRRAVQTRAAKIPDQFTTVQPHNDLVFVKVGEEEQKTAGGIYLPSQSQKKPTSGVVVAVGEKTKQIKVGDAVLYGKWSFGVTDLELKGEDHALMKESDSIGVMPKADCSVDDIPEMKPIGDRVLVKVDATEDQTKGGVLLPESAKEKPVSGVVVAVGPGKDDEEMKLAAGEKVMYFKYAGDKLMTSDGSEYVTLHQQDILCRVP